jgi:hypothetical protein
MGKVIKRSPSMEELEKQIKIINYSYTVGTDFLFLALKVKLPENSNKALHAAKFVVLTKYKLNNAANRKISAAKEASSRGKKTFYCEFNFCSDKNETFTEAVKLLEWDNVKRLKR